MARPNLTALLDSKPKPASAPPAPEPAEVPEPVAEREAPAREPGDAVAAKPVAVAPARSKRKAAPTKPAEPERFSELTRKESRFREDQIDDLAAVAKRLMRARTEPGPRITDNTIIRVAVDLLLSRADELQGNTEAELRASLMGE